MALSWTIVFGIMVFGLMVCPAVVFLTHLKDKGKKSH